MTTPASESEKRPKLLLLTGLVTFVASVLLFAPASLVAPIIKSTGADIQYQEISGTVWRGAFNGVSTGEVYLGDVSFRLRPAAFLTGAVSADVTAQDGAALGAARIKLAIFSRRVMISNANVAFDLSTVRRYTLFGIPYQGRVEARDTTVVWSPDGCTRAEGNIWTDVLDATSRTLVKESLLLAGPASCENGLMQITLKGANRQGETEIKIAIDPAMTYRVMASVDLGRADLENNLRQFGFEDDDGVMVFDVVGALKGAGS